MLTIFRRQYSSLLPCDTFLLGLLTYIYIYWSRFKFSFLQILNQVIIIISYHLQFYYADGKRKHNIISGIKKFWYKVKVKLLVVQSCLTLCDPMDCSLPASSVHGILQARTLEWVTIPSPGYLPDSGIKPGSPALQGFSILS